MLTIQQYILNDRPTSRLTNRCKIRVTSVSNEKISGPFPGMSFEVPAGLNCKNDNCYNSVSCLAGMHVHVFSIILDKYNYISGSLS